MSDEAITCGVAGTILSATGAGLSVTELQAIISIIVTVLGFVISVLIPLIVKLVKSIKKAKEDGKITAEEIEEITDNAKKCIDAVADGTEKVKELVDKTKGE